MIEDSLSLLLQEAHEAPQIVAQQLNLNRRLLVHWAARLTRMKPRLVLTCARGSSNNAAIYAKYLIETRLSLPVLCAAPSVGALYRAPIDLSHSVMLCISQSGTSFDLVENARWARSRGAWVISLLNCVDSPLAEVSSAVIPMHAGVERSVAASKSYIASLSAVLQLVTYWGKDAELSALLHTLPDQLEVAKGLDWSAAAEELGKADNLLVAGRGMSLCSAAEVALKMKETCGIHAESFSAAEFSHGPLTLVRHKYPVLLFGQADETAASTNDLARQLRAKGVRLFTVGCSTGVEPQAAGYELPVVPGIHPTAAPLTALQSFYGLADRVARSKGTNPDNPPHLSKVTRTL